MDERAKRVMEESNDHYLKALLILERTMPEIRQMDLANYMGFSKASVCKAVRTLQEKELVRLEGKHIHLTGPGRQWAQRVLEKHEYFTRILVMCGVEYQTASREACKMEHVISEESFRLLKKAFY